jgi:hypothetical protein
MGEAMADQDLMHTAEIVKAALPYVDSRTRGMAEFFTKILDLMGSAKALTRSNSMAACGFESGKLDIEGLLQGIRPILNIREREFIDRILNIFNMKRMFEMYTNIMKTMQEFGGGFPFGDFTNNDDTDNVTGNFSGMNFESIFQTFNAFNQSNNSSSEEDVFERAASNLGFFNNHKDDNVENDSESNNDFHSTDKNDDFNSTDKNDDFNSTEKNEASEENNSSGGFAKNPMFDMLKAMVPPEQLSTFENLSMLLNTMSYDNNSKSDDNKERNDG